MQILMGAALIALSLTMLAFAQTSGFVPVRRPIYRVYRADRPSYFWTLIAGYAMIGAIGIRILTR